MEKEFRRQVEALFEEILDRPEEEWGEAVEELSGGDEALAIEVRRLLSAHQRAEGMLERPFHLQTPTDPPDQTDRVLDTKIGNYLILQEIGRGGMGRVYLAERADGHFRQRVALKLIREADADLQARVVAERQILASLEHPNIGRLLDGGVTSDGRPFLVMEYVDGLPIDLYCDRMRLTIRERLTLFLTVLKAVEHAHRNLVVHRDLKPSNILVTPSGEVKLLDFGIAKILNPNLGGPSTPPTRDQDRALTPEYASPEQVRGEAITTAADLYSLGVVLYEILAGCRPFERRNGGLPELARTICEDDPPTPGARLSATEESTPRDDGEGRDPVEIARARHTTSSRLRRQLKGDVEAIVMKCLRKEPVRRYGSVELLSQDIRHFLNGLPVEARRGSRWYRIKKYARRHRGEAIAAGLVSVSLLAGAAAAAWQAREAAWERDRARAALRESEEVTDFLLGLFQSSDPLETPGDTVTALDLLSRGASRAGELRAEPLVQARMLRVMSRANLNLGRYAEAESLANQALELVTREFGDEHQSVAEALVQLGAAFRSGGQYDSAHAALDRARGIQERVLGPDALELSTTLVALAGIDVYLGDLDAAERRTREALTLSERHLGPNAAATLNRLSSLASILRFQARYTEAEAVFREVLRRRRGQTAQDPVRLSSDLLQVGDMLVTSGGDLDEAETLSQEALRLQEPGTGVNTVNRVWALTSLSNLKEARGDMEEADRLRREGVAERRRTFGDIHPLVSEMLGSLGLFLNRMGRLAEAEEVLREAEAVDLATVGADHTRHAGTLTGLAEVLVNQGRLLEADSLALQALQIRQRAQGSAASIVAQTLTILAEIRMERGMLASADTLLLQAEQISSGHREGAPLPRRIHGDLADLYERMGRPEESAHHRALAEITG
jgi:serine/threonine-protein kinase